MRPKAYVPSIAVLLAVLLAGCAGSDDTGDETDDRPGDTGTIAPPAEPGRYRTLPEPCGAVPQDSLNALLPGIKQLTDEEQRETAYEGEATQTFDTDRRVGCRWKVESADATHYLFVDFERVVSYDSAVSDDSKAEVVYTSKELAADLPEPTVTASDDGEDEEGEEGESSDGANPSESPSESASGSGSGSGDSSDSSGSSNSPGSSASPGVTETPAALQPRTLDDLGDEAFLNDVLSTARQRTVTVVFRTSNVIVTVEYAEQPASTTDVPDSKELQDRARNVAGRLAESFDE